MSFAMPPLSASPLASAEGGYGQQTSAIKTTQNTSQYRNADQVKTAEAKIARLRQQGSRKMSPRRCWISMKVTNITAEVAQLAITNMTSLNF
mmetsp:Transcript_13774/g.16689  ORF Transcript_13774/g.16689 Transcript_13774/m.16689 type:complete len:92 (-) Transcript_13774:196-471(-)